eukprot:g24278.t1
MIDDGKAVDVAYMDFSKAFDKVPHGRLIQKVKPLGIGGSVLGPLLFMTYRNDLEENVAGLIRKFADVTKIGGVADSEEDCHKIQQDIDQLEAWAEKWQMEFNRDKCEVMHFGKSSTGGNYTVNGRTLRSIEMQKDLGVQVHRSLKVAVQVDKVVKK